MTDLRYSPLHVTEFCGEMQGKFKVGLARLIRGHESSLQVQRTCFRGDETIRFETVLTFTKISGSDNCFVLVCKCNEISLFLVTKGNLTSTRE